MDLLTNELGTYILINQLNINSQSPDCVTSHMLCVLCQQSSPQIRRPSTAEPYCRGCFYDAFEREIHETIITQKLFQKGDRVAIAVSGGKGVIKKFLFWDNLIDSDSTVLAHLMTTLDRRYNYGLDLFLLAVDEGITVRIYLQEELPACRVIETIHSKQSSGMKFNSRFH